MRALRVTDSGLELAETPMPSREGECLVRVTASGICNTDLEIVRGYAGFIGTLGHEFVGVVEEDPSNAFAAGTRVVGEINVGCGTCEVCVTGDQRHCPQRTVLGIKGRDGAHAEFLSLPAANLLRVPDSVDDREAVFVEPLAAAMGIAERVDLSDSSRVAVIGDGKLGILCARSLALACPDVTLIGKHREKLALAEKSGIETLLAEDASKLSSEFELVVEASGSESGLDLALALTRPRGTIVLKSTYKGRPSWEAWRAVVDEIAIVGSRCGRFAPAIDALAERRVEVADLIDEMYPISEGIAAFRRAADAGTMKILLTM